MKKIAPILALCFCLSAAAQTQTDRYQFSVDLRNVTRDQLKVELITPKINSDTAVYLMPAMVPGTYSVYDFGRFVWDFEAADAQGNKLVTIRRGENSWVIPEAKKLYKITYNVEDTWDTPQKKAFVFEPGGTNIQADTNFVINTHGFFGYFKGMTRSRYEVSITHPPGFFGATGLNDVTRTELTDTYHVANYMDLADGPMMYCRPDTAHLLIGKTDVLISVYSPKKLVSAKFVADSLRVLLDQQRQYLGGTLPVNNYAFIIYLTDPKTGFKSGSLGALEHSYSSFYALHEEKPQDIAQMIKDVAAHEFFHIVTPLNIHSEQIGDFDFNKPQMSQHLWLYEGLTEYSAHHVQIKYGSMSLDDFLQVMRQKMVTSTSRYDDELAFTTMSKGVLDKYEEQYGNVYQKGALIAMCLDIKLLQLSDGTYGTQQLMSDLSKRFGKDKSFPDDSLFQIITAMTYPEIGDFFKRYVAGNEPLPFEEVLMAVGIKYDKKQKAQSLSPFGGYGLMVDDLGRLVLFPDEPNAFAREMGYQRGDEILSVNGKAVKLNNAERVLGKFVSDAMTKPGYKIKMKVRRRREDGTSYTVKLKGRMHPVEVNRRHVLTPMEDASPAQLKLRKAWINR
ncbi:MAG: peptidase M61 [Bacteroidia bacterium]|jgi:predicted metalloprotease with PDZ domain|nr:peptidase M61 [Bacteroidia bacterium]